MAKAKNKATGEDRGPWSSGEVARMLKVSPSRLEVVLRVRPDLSPPLVGGRRLWEPAHVEAVRARLAELEARRRPRRGPLP